MLLGQSYARQAKFKNIFAPKCTTVKKVEPEVIDDEKDDGIVIMQPKTDWLPGERLLKKINDDKKTRKKRKARQKRLNNLSDPDVDIVCDRMSRLVAGLV